MDYKPVQSESIYSLINSSKNQMEVMEKTRKDLVSKAYFRKYFDH
jgi:ubiquitin-activating enzyme E1